MAIGFCIFVILLAAGFIYVVVKKPTWVEAAKEKINSWTSK